MDGGRSRIKGFVEASFIDWPGRVAAVLFLPGCNFRCPFCHNPDLINNPNLFEDIPFDMVARSLRENDGWVDGVVVTGGEPTAGPGIEEFLGRLRGLGLPVRLDTNGSRPEILKNIINSRLIDAVAMDVKAPLTEAEYSRAAGVPVDIRLIEESIALILGSGLDAAFRTTAVPGLHDEESLKRIASAVRGNRLVLQNFRPSDALDPGYRKKQPLDPREVQRLQAVLDLLS